MTTNRGGLCPKCNFWHINQHYVDVIEQLVAGGLLPKDYKPICCECYAEQTGYKRSISRMGGSAESV